MLNMKIYRDVYTQIGDDVWSCFNSVEYNFTKMGIGAPKKVNFMKAKQDDVQTDNSIHNN